MQDDERVRSRVARICARPAPAALRGIAAALALATAVTVVGTAAVTGSSSAQPGLISNVTTTASDPAAAAVIAAARTHLGQKYVFGGSGPTTWDCSGLTEALWQTVGGVASIPRTARLQQAWAIPVPAAQVLPGDLYFLGTPATHVGIVVGAGMVLDASASHGDVLLRSLWTATDITFGRVPRPGAVPVTGAPVTAPPVTAPPVITAPAPASPVSAPTAPVAPAPAVTKPPVAAPTAPASPTTPVTVPPVTIPPSTVPPSTSPTVAAPPVSSAAAHFVTAAKRIVGAPYQAGGVGPSYDDGALVAVAWHRSEGGVLPLDRNALAARSTPVSVTHLLPGDLVIYGTTVVWHVGIYVGHGMMVDSSRINGRVVLRRVFTSPDRHFGRLH